MLKFIFLLIIIKGLIYIFIIGIIIQQHELQQVVASKGPNIVNSIKDWVFIHIYYMFMYKDNWSSFTQLSNTHQVFLFSNQRFGASFTRIYTGQSI